MSTTSEFLGQSAAARAIEHGGRTYHVGRLDQSGMEAFSAWLIEWTRKQLVLIYGHDQAALALRLAALERDVLGGVYEFTEELVMGREVWLDRRALPAGQECWRDAGGAVVERAGPAAPEPRTGRDVEGGVLHTSRGRVQLAAVLVGCGADEAQRLIQHRPAEMAHLISLALKESFGEAPPREAPWAREGGEGNAPPPAGPAPA